MAQDQSRAIDWRLVGLVFVLTAGAMVVRALVNAGTVPLLADTDDAMRLVQVRDLIGGQNWFDAVQHRLNTPHGAEMHWSKLIDLPIAALILVVQPLAGGMTETIVAYLWPLLLLAGLLILTAKLSVRLAGPEALLPGLALPAFSLITMVEFAPGRLDHHSVQILLALAMALLTIGAVTSPARAIGAGIAAATAIAIGGESLPSVVAAILAFGLLWVFDGQQSRALRWFGLSFAGASVAHLALALPPERWASPYCDAISVVYVTAALGVGVAFTLLSMLLLPASKWWVRLAAGIGAAAVLFATLALLFPHCLGGPYANLDPWLMSHWIDRIDEAKPIWTTIRTELPYVVAVGLPVLLGLGVTLIQLIRAAPVEREKWLVYAVFLGLTALVMLLQNRGARIATPLVLPAGAALIVMARGAYLRRGGVGPLLGMVSGWIGFAGLAVGFAAATVAGLAAPSVPTNSSGATATGLSDTARCRMPSSFTALAQLPKARLMAPIDLGAHLLAFTPHDVVAAPYHRNTIGVRDTFDFFNAPIAQAHAILERRGIDYVVICPGMPELAGLPDAAPDAFVQQLKAQSLPKWLVEISAPDTILRVYQVTGDL